MYYVLQNPTVIFSMMDIQIKCWNHQSKSLSFLKPGSYNKSLLSSITCAASRNAMVGEGTLMPACSSGTVIALLTDQERSEVSVDGYKNL